MLNINSQHNTHLEPADVESIDLNIALKNYALFTKIDEQVHVAQSERYLDKSANYVAKLEENYPTIFLDEESYDRLYNRFLEVRTDKEMTNISNTDEMGEIEDEDDLSLTEFLRNSADILASEESAPIIKFVNSLFYQAIKRRASDIHIEMHEFKGEVRYRIDGVLIKHVDLDEKIMNLIISRIKVISNLDISEKRVPQDGRTQVKIAGKTLDIRVSVLPTFYGERVVMRILMQSEDIPHLNDLGFSEHMTRQFQDVLQYSHGIILVTGPTGSGKSTTLHAFLQEVATEEKNIITVEDPVEYKADNINQIQVNSKVGLTFSAGLRSILRQDPDVVMIGEIRDSETATIAIQAALTGHLVLSTLHTNNATASIARLDDMGVAPYLISSSVIAVLAQRLVRKLCTECKEEDTLGEEYADTFELPKNALIYKAKGCSKCGYSGYHGREALGELFLMSDGIKSAIKETTNDHVLRAKALEEGMQSIPSQLKQILLKGETSLDEAIRVGLKDA